MKKLCVSAAIVAGVSSVASAGISIEVVASSAPNAFGSPSWGAYMANSLNSLELGLGNIGDRLTDPTAYEVAADIVDPSEFMVSSFNSWRGDASPTGAFASELGNRMHFGLRAAGDGVMQFRLEDISFELVSSDPGNALGYAGDFVGLSYSSARYGIDWGADRVKGGGDDTVYTTGNGATLVDEIIYVGVGNAFWPGGGDPDPSNPIGGAQAAMDDSIAWVIGEAPFSMTATYTILGAVGSDTITAIPTPGAAPMLLGAVVMLTRRNRKV